MLAYAASRPATVERRPYPNALLAIIALHVAALAAVMSAKMDIPILKGSKTTIFWVKPPETPPPTANPDTRAPRPQPQDTPVTVTRPERQVEIALPQDPPLPGGGTLVSGPPAGQIAANIPTYRPPAPSVVKLGPTLLTSGEALKPPYPSSKLVTEEDASLTLRLAIDERGRVVGVQPVGRVDRVFLDAARRHLIANWRYRPASEDGRPTASSAVITLRFQLDG